MKLLLHMCCAPCSVYPVRALRDEGFEPQGFFYNPNIHPIKEFLKRKENVEKYSLLEGLQVVYDDQFEQDKWENFNDEQLKRCNMCYSLRLDRTAAYAKEKGFDAYTSTLLVSPYQNHELLKELGQKFGEKYGVEFLYRDFREGYRQGQQQAREMDLYRQKFCGCIISYNESPHKHKITW